MEKPEKKPYITFLLMLSEKEGMEPNEFQIPYGSQRASLLLHWIEGNRESARVVVLNLDTKILMTEVCWDGCYKCFLINDESAQAGSWVSRNGRELTMDNLGLLMGMQKYENSISLRHRGKESVPTAARENTCLIICFELASSWWRIHRSGSCSCSSYSSYTPSLCWCFQKSEPQGKSDSQNALGHWVLTGLIKESQLW